MATASTTTPSPSASPPPQPHPQPQPKPPPNPKPVSTWTHHETINLIQAYQEKWYSLKRGQLKASQWEEVAVAVAAKCGYDHTHPSAKSAIQCRHKMEKLRKRYRTEKQSGAATAATTTRWPYFPLMDCLERGPLPISVRPVTQLPFDDYGGFGGVIGVGGNGNEEGEEEEEEEEEEDECYSKSRSINYILRKPTFVNRFSSGFTLKRPRTAAEEVMEVEGNGDGDGEEMVGRSRSVKVGAEMVAGEIRRFAERFVRMEKRKMEMVKETEKWRMEMENRKIQMILESQRKIVDIIHTAFGSHSDDDDRPLVKMD